MTASVLEQSYERIQTSEYHSRERLCAFDLIQDISRFRLLLGVKAEEDRNSSLEPSMIAFEFKTVFITNETRVSTNWKIDTGWQNEQVVDSDWIDMKGSKFQWIFH